MVLAIIFLVIFAGITGFGIYRTVSLIKTPMIEVDFKKFFLYQGLLVAGSAIKNAIAEPATKRP